MNPTVFAGKSDLNSCDLGVFEVSALFFHLNFGQNDVFGRSEG